MQTTESHYETVLTMPPWVREYASKHGLTAPASDVEELVSLDREPSHLPVHSIA